MSDIAQTISDYLIQSEDGLSVDLVEDPERNEFWQAVCDNIVGRGDTPLEAMESLADCIRGLDQEIEAARKRLLELADRLFLAGNGEVADRLVLMSKDGRDLGGWSQRAVVDQIVDALKGMPLRDAPGKRKAAKAVKGKGPICGRKVNSGT